MEPEPFAWLIEIPNQKYYWFTQSKKHADFYKQQKGAIVTELFKRENLSCTEKTV